MAEGTYELEILQRTPSVPRKISHVFLPFFALFCPFFVRIRSSKCSFFFFFVSSLWRNDFVVFPVICELCRGSAFFFFFSVMTLKTQQSSGVQIIVLDGFLDGLVRQLVGQFAVAVICRTSKQLK